MALIDLLNPITTNIYLQALIILAVFFTISKIIVIFFEKIILRLTRKTKTKVDDLIVERTNKPISLLLILIGLRLATETINLNETFQNIIVNAISSFVVIVVTYIVMAVFDVIIDGWGKKLAEKTKSKIDDQLVSVLHRFSKILFVILGFLFVLDVWGVKIGPLVASLGIAGIAIAFALQSTLGNIFGGISMIIDKTIKVGDVIELDATTRGKVVDVGLRSTRIRTFNNETIIIPNGKLADSQINNYAPPDPSVRVVVPFSVAYGSNIEQVKKIVLKEIPKIDHLMKDPKPYVRFREMADSSLNFKAYFWVDHFSERFAAIDQANTFIYNTLNKAKITIPFPQIDIHLKKK